ncbi:hypothetical protein C1H46_038571 [Malus baccata]|uniref:Ribosomal protein L18e/L15P domain-containing protein n=1 Tax=Malus baccata TaxID=106549 RepID=A0A540KNW1_MALBA|nr:hypothetical protein C1H46_038571 [Malus baccata]
MSSWQPVGLGKIATLINAGKIDSSELITMKRSRFRAIGKQIEDGVRLMGRGAEQIQWPIHLEILSYANYFSHGYGVNAYRSDFGFHSSLCCMQLENGLMRGLQVSRVTVRAKEAVEAAGGSVRRVYYNKLGLRALLKPEWFDKKGRLLPKAARPPLKQKDEVDGSSRLPAPTKPIPFFTYDKELASAST